MFGSKRIVCWMVAALFLAGIPVRFRVLRIVSLIVCGLQRRSHFMLCVLRFHVAGMNSYNRWNAAEFAAFVGHLDVVSYLLSMPSSTAWAGSAVIRSCFCPPIDRHFLQVIPCITRHFSFFVDVFEQLCNPCWESRFGQTVPVSSKCCWRKWILWGIQSCRRMRHQ